MLLLLAAEPATVVTVTGSSVTDLLVSQGPMGILCAMLLGGLYILWAENKRLRQQVDDEKSARLVDANLARDKLLEMSDKVHQTTDDLAKIADRMEKTK